MTALLVIAHRGAWNPAPENSLAAFRRAVDLGADAVELDIHATIDGALLVHHDPVIDDRAIPQSSRDALRDVRLANGEALPTLDAALEAIGPTLTVFIEVKTLPAAHDAQLFAAIDGGPAPQRYHVHGFDHRIVRRLLTQRPGLVGGVLSASYPVRPVLALTDSGAVEMWQDHSLIDEALVQAVHAAGCRLYAWTVDAVDEARRLATWGVDGICTNHVERMRQLWH